MKSKMLLLLTMSAALILRLPAVSDEKTQPPEQTFSETIIQLTGGPREALAGRVLMEVGSTVLLETPDSVLHLIRSADIKERSESGGEFRSLDRHQMAARLLERTGDGFQITFGNHHVVCSDASKLFTDYCVRLLNKTTVEYQKFFSDSDVKLHRIPDNMSVIVFRTQSEFQAYAKKQHPDTDFSDVPGYYSVRDNQMLIGAAAGDREYRGAGDVLRKLKTRIRLVETVVHEAVHQLAFNSGLQARYADTPLWISEGLAVYFERASGTGQTLWIRPGGVSRIHLRGLRAATGNDRLSLPLSQLMAEDTGFTTQPAAAYAEGWAVVYFLARRDRKSLDRLLNGLSKTPLQQVTPQQRLDLIRQATGRTPDELENEVIRYMKTVKQR